MVRRYTPKDGIRKNSLYNEFKTDTKYILYLVFNFPSEILFDI